MVRYACQLVLAPDRAAFEAASAEAAAAERPVARRGLRPVCAKVKGVSQVENRQVAWYVRRRPPRECRIAARRTGETRERLVAAIAPCRSAASSGPSRRAGRCAGCWLRRRRRRAAAAAAAACLVGSGHLRSRRRTAAHQRAHTVPHASRAGIQRSTVFLPCPYLYSLLLQYLCYYLYISLLT